MLVGSTIVALGLLLPCALFAQSAAKTPASARHEQKPAQKSAVVKKSLYAYFFDLTGDFEEVDVRTNKEVARGQIPVAAKIVQPFQTSGIDGCILCGVRYDKKFGRFYIVMAKQASDSETSTNNFEVVAIAPPRMQTISRVDVSFAVPVVLVNSEGNRVLASYQVNPGASTAGKLSYGLSIFRAPTLKLLRTGQESTTAESFAAGYVFKSRFSEQAYFGPDGNIYDQLSRGAFRDDELNKVEIDPVALLVKSGDKALAPFALVDLRTNSPTFDVTYIDSAAGKTLIALNATRSAPQALIVIDLKNQTFSPVMKVTEVTVPATHLTPDGKQIVIEESKLRHRADAKPDEPQETLFTTGNLTIFSAVTMEKVREFSAPKISGFESRLICMSVDAKIAFFAHDRHLVGVDLTTGAESEVHTRSQFVFDNWTKCVMADR